MSIPKYQQIKQNLLYEINNGKFLPGDKFYSEAELKRKYNVSGITAIKALQCLTNEGYLVRYQGKGTYVSKAKRGKIVKFSDIEKYKDGAERTEVLAIRRMKDPRIAAQLDHRVYPGGGREGQGKVHVHLRQAATGLRH